MTKEEDKEWAGYNENGNIYCTCKAKRDKCEFFEDKFKESPFLYRRLQNHPTHKKEIGNILKQIFCFKDPEKLGVLLGEIADSTYERKEIPGSNYDPYHSQITDKTPKELTEVYFDRKIAFKLTLEQIIKGNKDGFKKFILEKFTK